MGLNSLLVENCKFKQSLSPKFAVETSFRHSIKNVIKENWLRPQVIDGSVSQRSYRSSISSNHFPPDLHFGSVRAPAIMGLSSAVLHRKDAIKFPVLVNPSEHKPASSGHNIVLATTSMLTSTNSNSNCRDFEEAEGIYHTTLLAEDDSEINLYFPSKYTKTTSNKDLVVGEAKDSKLDVDKVKKETLIYPILNVAGSKAKCAIRLPTNKISRAVTTDNKIKFRRKPHKLNRDDMMKSLDQRLETAQKKTRPKTATGAQEKGRKVRNIPKPLPSIFTCVTPSNLNEEKEKFFDSDFTYNPQFKYSYPLHPNALQRHNNPSNKYMNEALAILNNILKRHGSYDKFEALTGGRLLNRTQIWNMVKKYLEQEGFYGDVVVNIGNDILSRAAMTVCGGRPTLSIRESSARQFWVEGLLRHEIGTHHLRFHNNRQQAWCTAKIRRQMGLKPANPTEEGLASLHSVISRKDPGLWRAAMLYYTAYKASQMSFSDLFNDLGKFLSSADVRWDYCLRTKRGQTDTSKHGCFAKDQVYLTGILNLLERRHTLDFHMLCKLGKVSFEDIDMLKDQVNDENTKIPSFMKDLDLYRKRLDHIVAVNGLDKFFTSKKPVETGD